MLLAKGYQVFDFQGKALKSDYSTGSPACIPFPDPCQLSKLSSAIFISDELSPLRSYFGRFSLGFSQAVDTIEAVDL